MYCNIDVYENVNRIGVFYFECFFLPDFRRRMNSVDEEGAGLRMVWRLSGVRWATKMGRPDKV
ncbi:hypothetical protein BARVI_04380 [Barnesiella viscericola DSM 18177]|uniref:Uncharacterized protein n=1 Tax=Barnesiella viscericola DSM 18177 TaxID=880074 RepID=W0EXA8_9BACT|nr:hypothetical protein BARVI_04380 [Barnesiella viscericola DSM 18177]